MVNNCNVYYLVIVQEDSMLTGWTANPFIVKTYYGMCVKNYVANKDKVTVMEFLSKHELISFIDANSEELFDIDFHSNCFEKIDNFICELELTYWTSKSIGGNGKNAISTYRFVDDILSNGYMDGIITDAHAFAYIMDYITRILFRFVQKDIIDSLQSKLSILLDYAHLSEIREEFDCSTTDYDVDLENEEFQTVRNAFLSSTGIDIAYTVDDDAVISYYNNMFCDLTWMICCGLTIDWI